MGTKILLIIFFCAELFSCKQSEKTDQLLMTKIDSLQKKIDESYTPGLGEFMSNIQVHHIKLWFAGKNKNWELANFEMNEIKESIDGIRKYCSDRQESKAIGMISQWIVSILQFSKKIQHYSKIVSSF